MEQRVDGALVIFFGRVFVLVEAGCLGIVYINSNNGFRDDNDVAGRVSATFSDDAIALDLEILGHDPERLAGLQLKAGLGGVVGVASGLAVFHAVQDVGEAWVAFGDLKAHLREAPHEVGLPGLVGHGHDPFVADDGGVDMFVGRGVLDDGAGVEPGLVSKRGCADVGGRAEGHAVEDVIEHARHAGQVGKRFFRDARFKARRIRFFQQKRRNQRCQVGIAAAFAEAIEGALDVPRARVDGGQGVGDSVARVVVGMDAKAIAGDARRDDFFCDFRDFRR